MAEGTNLDFILSTDYLSVDDQKILNEKKEAEKKDAKKEAKKDAKKEAKKVEKKEDKIYQ